jgi:pyruvate/2-oxoglutarate dehydrogenase complex dihydrolipoamide dehydrogenase (E3) component
LPFNQVISLTEVDRAPLDGESEGLLTLKFHACSGKISSASLLARHAGEMVSDLNLALRRGLGLSDLAHRRRTRRLAGVFDRQNPANARAERFFQA